jgi:hypothetical protein
MTAADLIYIGRFDQKLAVQRLFPPPLTEQLESQLPPRSQQNPAGSSAR